MSDPNDVKSSGLFLFCPVSKWQMLHCLALRPYFYASAKAAMAQIINYNAIYIMRWYIDQPKVVQFIIQAKTYHNINLDSEQNLYTRQHKVKNVFHSIKNNKNETQPVSFDSKRFFWRCDRLRGRDGLLRFSR